MNIKNNLVNFLYDKNYFISIYDNFIHVFNYKKLISLTSKVIVLKLDNFTLTISGDNLFVSKMLINEILIQGIITKVGIDYEK